MPDIVVLGATGFTGRLISRYLASHPQSGRFSWAIAARSKSKLSELVKELSLSADVGILELNVKDEHNVEQVVKKARVVINTVGPFSLYGTPVVRACVRNAVHYVDLTGDIAWARDIVIEYDYAATKTGAIIVPSCGMDSVPSDMTAYLSNKTLKAALEEAGHNDFTGKGSSAQDSLTAYQLNIRPSGGTLNTMLTKLDDDPVKVSQSRKPYSLSPAIGIPIPSFKGLYKLSIPEEKPLVGGYFVMRGSNTAIVQRTYGLFETQAIEEELNRPSLPSHVVTLARKQRYGPLFKYDEFVVKHSAVKAVIASYGFALMMLLLTYVRPIRQFARKFMTQPGDGPSEEEMQKGSLIGTNLTTSSTQPPVQVKSVIKITGDPGYLKTATMISECALSLLLPPASVRSGETTKTYSAIPTLPQLAQRGGVLTPVTAFGDILLQRLTDTGSFEFSSSVVDKQKHV
ncbi:hypothetical protein M378DRAFT_84153 [Amanita muscaria Koide BX008]|uniref:Saccharopine dehydrogenase NADP binding domain-containing protein n=1 Tax=Amanita muscaria (strain Koide BX008) TaxID=946122 RepID=A0A0C2T117_AMAMK|nr:hypothetical protein M378DRAFT_84153 [Amanita muscaria Koide BX008]